MHHNSQPGLRHDTDQVLATAFEPSSGLFPYFDNNKTASRHKKSIRQVAAEAAKKNIQSTQTGALRRRNTKLWGNKLEEVTTAQGQAISALPESSTNRAPKPIFKWVRGELIGKGSGCCVYLALNATTGEMMTAKQVEITQDDTDRDDKGQVNVIETLKYEYETMKDLDHPNLVQYLGLEQTPSFLCTFLEYVPGESIAACLVKHGKFEDQVARSFTGQILSGLEYLHARDIIHGELGVDNIIIDLSGDRQGTCKISHFSVHSDGHGGIWGAMRYIGARIPPEGLGFSKDGQKLANNVKVDIWSLGCVVLEMWADHQPRRDVEPEAIRPESVTKEGGPPVPLGIIPSADADDFRRKCFTINPDERPSARELRQHPYLILPPGWTFTGFV